MSADGPLPWPACQLAGWDRRPGLAERCWILVLDELRDAGYGAPTFPMGWSGPSRSLRSILTELRSRHCPAPIASEAWLTMLATGGFEDRSVLGDEERSRESDRDAPRDPWQFHGYGSQEAEEDDEEDDTEERWP